MDGLSVCTDPCSKIENSEASFDLHKNSLLGMMWTLQKVCGHRGGMCLGSASSMRPWPVLFTKASDALPFDVSPQSLDPVLRLLFSPAPCLLSSLLFSHFPVKQPANPPPNPPTNHTSQPTHQPANQPANQPIKRLSFFLKKESSRDMPGHTPKRTDRKEQRED